jgi:hypothetical protein
MYFVQAQSSAIVRQSAYRGLCQIVIKLYHGIQEALVNSTRILKPDALAAIVSGFHKQGIKAQLGKTGVFSYSSFQHPIYVPSKAAYYCLVRCPSARRPEISHNQLFLSSEYIGQSIPTTQIPLMFSQGPCECPISACYGFRPCGKLIDTVRSYFWMCQFHKYLTPPSPEHIVLSFNPARALRIK